MNFQEIIDNYFYIYSILFTISIISSFIIILLIKRKESIYSRMIYKITFSETIFVFSHFLLIIPYTAVSYFYPYYELVIKYLFFGLFPLQLSWITINYIIVIVSNVYTYCMNIFLCLEMILILKNPVSHSKKRTKIYTIISLLFCLCDSLFIYNYSGRIDKENASPFEYYLDYIKQYNLLLLNTALYVCFCIFGLLSIAYLLYRFCFGQFIISKIKHYFVIRHFLYVFINIVIYLPFNLFVVYSKFYQDQFISFKNILIIISMFCNSSLSLILFFVKISETSICICLKETQLAHQKEEIEEDETVEITKDSTINKTFQKRDTLNFFENDQPLAAMISRWMNVEFMCCILYGLTSIFEKIQKRKIKKAEGKQKSMISIKVSDCSDVSGNYYIDSTDENKQYKVVEKDFRKTIKHNIQYQNIGDNEVDLTDFNVKVKTQNSFHKKKILLKKEKGGASSSSLNDNDNSEHSLLTSYQDSFTNQLEKYDAVIIDYCPRIFRILHKRDNNIDEEIAKSLSPLLNIEGLKQMKKSQGKSGSFFFFSFDNKLLIKTITNDELDTLKERFLKNYHCHIIKNPDSFLARIYGVYTIIIHGISQINIVLMQNLNPLGNNYEYLHRIFDLKGSLFERKTKNIQKAPKDQALKDLDFLYMKKVDKTLIDFTRNATSQIIESLLQKDLILLTDNNLMDYSILLYIFKVPEQSNEGYSKLFELFKDVLNQHRVYLSKNRKYLYLIGIIDYFQEFNTKKFLENKYKKMLYGKEVANISAVNPTIYSNRMFEFARNHIFVRGGGQ